MKNIFCWGVLFLIVGTSTMVFGQTKPLKIGDAIPASVWTTPLQVVNAPQKTTTLSADKGKLILLDFWNTWCSACLLYFPKMEKLKEQFGDKVKILAVGDQDRATLEKFFATTNGQRYKSTVSIAGDKMFNTIFPHRGVPYVVWIKDGKLVNTTDAAQVNEKTIAEVLGNEKSSLQTVIQMSRDRPLMLSEAFDRQKNLELLNYSFFAKGHIPDIGAGGTLRKTNDGKVYGRQWTNLPMWDILFSIGYELFTQNGEKLNEKRIIYDVTSPANLKAKVNADGTLEKDNLYSYDFIGSKSNADSLYNNILQDINRYSPYNTTLEVKQTKCLVLVRTSKIDKLATKGGAKISTFPRSPSQLQNVPLGHMVNMLNGNIEPAIPVIDDTGYTGRVDLKVSGVKDLTTLRQELAYYDLDIIEAERNLMMMVIRDAAK